MGDKLIKTITGPFIRVLIASIIILAVVLLYYDWLVGLCAFGMGLVFIVFALIIKSKLKAWTNSVLEDAVITVDESAVSAVINHPIPLCVVNSKGVILIASERFKELFPGTIVMESKLRLLAELKVELSELSNEQISKRLTIKNSIYDVILTELSSVKKTGW